MKFDKFQKKIGAIFDEDATMGVLFVAEEAGEVAKEFKKEYKNNDNTLNTDAVKEEMGDVLVALAVLANAMGLDLDDIVAEALDKWTKRQQEKQGN